MGICSFHAPIITLKEQECKGFLRIFCSNALLRGYSIKQIGIQAFICTFLPNLFQGFPVLGLSIQRGVLDFRQFYLSYHSIFAVYKISRTIITFTRESPRSQSLKKVMEQIQTNEGQARQNRRYGLSIYGGIHSL
jgi:hypothetical protein